MAKSTPPPPGSPPESGPQPDRESDAWTRDAGPPQNPHLDHVMRSAAADMDSFPRLFIDEQVHGPVTGKLLQLTVWHLRHGLQLDYAAFIHPGPDAGSGLDAWVINIEFVTRYRRKELSDLLRRHYHGLKQNIAGRVLVQPYVLAVGSRVPAATSVEYDTTPGRAPIHAPIKHISQLSSTLFSAADRELAIGKIVTIMMADGQTEESVNRAVTALFAVSDPAKYCNLMEKLSALADGRPEFRQWIRDACRREDQRMPVAVREARRELFIDSFLEDSPFRDSVQAAAQEKGRKEGRDEGLKEGRDEGLKEGRDEGLKKGREEGRDEGKQEAHVKAMLVVLRERGIELSPAQKSALQHLPCAVLPDVRVALHAEDADEFVRLTGLPTDK